MAEKINDGKVGCYHVPTGKSRRMTPSFSKSQNFKKMGWILEDENKGKPPKEVPKDGTKKPWKNMNGDERKEFLAQKEKEKQDLIDNQDNG